MVSGLNGLPQSYQAGRHMETIEPKQEHFNEVRFRKSESTIGTFNGKQVKKGSNRKVTKIIYI